VTGTPTSGSGAKLNLQIWNAGQTSSEVKVGVRITNYGGTAIALNRLKVKVWIDDLGTGDLIPVVYGANQMTVYSSAGQWQSGVDAVSANMASISPSKDCGSSRRADKRASAACQWRIPRNRWQQYAADLASQ
jgi:hypothetical protein